MAEAAAQLPVVAELLAACLAAGSGPREAAGAVGGSMGGPLGERLVRASAELRLGGEPAAVWGRLEELPEAAELARCLERAGTTGVPAVEPMGRLAAECRARRARAAAERTRRAAVRVTAPLGLCFLPAFLLAGVAPVVIGLARSLP
ncbi:MULTISPECIES: type II secretion system F family protein [Streptomyces]|uniref:Type II secretion system F family protein n=1 Tax=Streptomyces desertarenae TaxID=2666184 RepID=A0ABW4PGQ1_9ACTN